MRNKNKLKKNFPQVDSENITEQEEEQEIEKISSDHVEHVALMRIMHNGRLFNVGDVVQGLSHAQAQILISGKSIEAK